MKGINDIIQQAFIEIRDTEDDDKRTKLVTLLHDSLQHINFGNLHVNKIELGKLAKELGIKLVCIYRVTSYYHKQHWYHCKSPAIMGINNSTLAVPINANQCRKCIYKEKLGE